MAIRALADPQTPTSPSAPARPHPADTTRSPQPVLVAGAAPEHVVDGDRMACATATRARLDPGLGSRLERRLGWRQ